LQEVKALRFQDNRHVKVVRLSVLHTGRLYSSVDNPDTHFCWRPSRPQGHSAAGRIMSMENSCDLPACSAEPKPTATQRAPRFMSDKLNIGQIFHRVLQSLMSLQFHQGSVFITVELLLTVGLRKLMPRMCCSHTGLL
jgi:hypothetical protein